MKREHSPFRIFALAVIVAWIGLNIVAATFFIIQAYVSFPDPRTSLPEARLVILLFGVVTGTIALVAIAFGSLFFAIRHVATEKRRQPVDLPAAKS